MTDMVASLTVTGDASGVVTAGKQGGQAVQGLIEKTTGLSRETRRAADSAEVFERQARQNKVALDQLRSAYDPVYAATRRLKAGEDTLRQALSLGTISVQQRDKLLETLRAEYQRATAATEAMAGSTGRLTRMTRGGAGGIQNFSFQLQDLFTQVGMGVPVMISLGQQAPQLLSGFGAVGAILGVVAAGALPLAAAVFGLGYNSSQAKDEIEGLKSAVAGYQEASNLASASTDELRERFGQFGEEIRDTLKLMAQFELSNALSSMKTAIEGLDVGRLEKLVKVFEAGPGEIEALSDQYNFALRDIQEEFGLTGEAAVALVNGFEELNQAEGPAEVRDAAREINKTLISAFGTALKMPAPFAEISEKVAEVEVNATELQNTMTKSGDATEGMAAAAEKIRFDGAIASARALSSELSTALETMFQLQSQGANNLARAKIRYDFRNDPVGEAGALAGLRFDTDTAALSRDGFANVAEEVFLRQQRDQVVNDAKEAARLNKARADALKKSRRSGGSGARSKAEKAEDRTIREIGRLRDTYDADLRAAQEWREKSLANLNPAREGYDQFAADVEAIFQDRLADAYSKDLDRRDDWKAGIERGLEDINDDMRSWADISESLVTSWSEGLEDAFVELGLTGKASVKDLVDFTLEQFLRLAYQKAVQPAISGVFDILGGALGNIFGGSGGGTALRSHSGSEIGKSAVSRSYGPGARLGRDERMTVTQLGQRVFTPRQMDNGAAVVDALAMAAQRPVVIGAGGGDIVINNYSKSKVEASRSEDGRAVIDIIDEVEGKIAGNVAKGQGALHSVLSQKYGIKKSFGSGQR